MIGISMRPEDAAGHKGLFEYGFLNGLYDSGVRSVELRPVRADADREIVRRAAWNIRYRGLRVSVHADPRSCETAVSDVLDPLNCFMDDTEQRDTVIVLHPQRGKDLVGDNSKMLERLIRECEKSGWSVRFAVENTRKMPDGTPGDGAELVKRIVEPFDPSVCGICFDFGHYAWYTRFWENGTVLPPKGFAERVIHTHIHALAGAEKDHTTHFPLSAGKVPLGEYIGCIPADNAVVYNLELEPGRFAGLMNMEQGITESLPVLFRTLSSLGRIQ